MRHLAAYVWASPNTALGLATAALVLLFGGRGRLQGGVLEVAGGAIGRLMLAPRLRCPFRAITLGHVIVAADSASLEASRAHERVHVRQYEHWGPLFLPAYLASSLWQLACGRRCYRDNWFERQAYDRS